MCALLNLAQHRLPYYFLEHNIVQLSPLMNQPIHQVRKQFELGQGLKKAEKKEK
jgi:hypothetical protein